jgi:chromate transport protein ChrA
VQSAFESAPLSDSYPGVVTAQLLCAIGIGLFVLNGRIELGMVHVLIGILALVAMILGMVTVTRSTVLSHSAAHPGLPLDLEQELE